MIPASTAANRNRRPRGHRSAELRLWALPGFASRRAAALRSSAALPDSEIEFPSFTNILSPLTRSARFPALDFGP